ncbi:MAG TPA: ribose 5-phosphate isomerase B [Limnochordia bacterium]|nr:ribose 5-phosphate isomerase B [Limnochordia bacterium]
MAPNPKRVVFICTGNTCRSPMAAALTRRHLRDSTLAADFEIESAGLYAAKGEPAAEGARRALQEWRISLAEHRSQPITAAMVARTDLFLTMTAAHRDLLVDLYPEARGKTHTVAEFAGDGPYDVPDPYGGDDAVYRACAQQLDGLTGRTARRLLGQPLPDAGPTPSTEGLRMRIAFGCDHAGFPYKESLINHLQGAGHEVTDLGTYGAASVDYPDFAAAVAAAVAAGSADLGVLVCGSGIGVSIAANKVNGARAALCHEPFSARMARAHNDANIVCLGARVIGLGLAFEVVDAFVQGAFEGGRHAARVRKIAALETEHS